ncbi:hypothetical protein EK21DRAFT_44080, partial [Setomelanomma holmii]
MANEEQRRAFASYMGTANASAGQQAPQNPGGFASSGNPYLFQVPDAATGHELFYRFVSELSRQLPRRPSNFPQRPPPLGQNEVFQGQRSMQSSARPQGYVEVPRNYSNQPPLPAGYNSGWQYTDPKAQQTARLNGEPAPRGAMVPSSRDFSGEIVESRSKHMSEKYHYQQYGQPSPGAHAPPPQVEEQTVPVLLCHTCSVCSRMRSAGYHRHNPVVPGKPLVLTPCRRCKNKLQRERRSMSSYTRIRSCTAEDPCDWPRESVRVDIEQSEQRGRRRDREEVRVYRHSPSRPRIIRQSSSQTRLGLRVLQDQGPPRMMRAEARIRVSSLSPRRESRYDKIWPPPDVVPTQPSRSGDTVPPPWMNPNITSQDEVWPPPDVVPTHSYRKVAVSPPRRQSSRIIELTPSPPPVRTRSTRVVYRSESRERRPRSPSPVHVKYSEERRVEEAEERVMSHPRPYRSVLPDHRNFIRTSDETSSNDYTARGRPESPSRSILKPPRGDRETSRRRTSMRESQQSTTVEVGGPK